MTNFFKMTVLATALLAAGNAAAAQLQEADVTVVGISKQATNALTTNGGSILLTAGAAYATGTEITVTFSAGEMTVAPTASSAGDTWVRVAQTATSATFRLTAGDTVLVGEKVTFSGHQWTTASVLAAGSLNVTVAVKADTGVAIDPAGTNQKLTRLVALAADEFTTAVASADVLNKVVVLAGGRTAFEGATTADKSTHVLKVTTTDLTGAPYKDDAGANTSAAFVAQATKADTTYTFAGDFSWVKDTDATKEGVQPHASTFGLTANCSLTSVDAAKAVVACTSAVTLLTVTLDVYQGGSKAPIALNDTTFTVAASQAFTAPAGSLATLAATKVGSWSNDGTTKTVPYMPYGEGTSQILYVTNNSSTVGPIKVTAWDEKGVKVLTSVKVGDTVASGITQVSAGVKDALAAAGVTSSKVKLVLDIESKGADVFSAYNVSGDRLFTPNK